MDHNFCKGCIFDKTNYVLDIYTCLKHKCHPLEVKDCKDKETEKRDNLMEFYLG
jgi:hypothetical protein